MRIGTNVTHINPHQAVALNCKHLEVSILWDKDTGVSQQKTLARIREVEATGCDYSIHLPIFTENYPYHVFSAYFLDEDPEVRNASFLMVEENLKSLSEFCPKFFVIHFSGIYPKRDKSLHNSLLTSALEALNQLGDRYDCQLYLEYFGFNEDMVDARAWEPILRYPRLGLLLDTGHLCLSARMHNQSFNQVFKEFLPLARAIHLWNTGDDEGAYEASPSYMTYHHMAPRLFQNPSGGYAIDMKRVHGWLQSLDMPVIIEASLRHADSGSLEETILEWVNESPVRGSL